MLTGILIRAERGNTGEKKVSQVRMRKQHANSSEVNRERKNRRDIVTIEGSRIIHKLSQYMNELTVRTFNCGGAFTLKGEMIDRLASILAGR